MNHLQNHTVVSVINETDVEEKSKKESPTKAESPAKLIYDHKNEHNQNTETSKEKSTTMPSDKNELEETNDTKSSPDKKEVDVIKHDPTPERDTVLTGKKEVNFDEDEKVVMVNKEADPSGKEAKSAQADKPDQEEDMEEEEEKFEAQDPARFDPKGKSVSTGKSITGWI